MLEFSASAEFLVARGGSDERGARLAGAPFTLM